MTVRAASLLASALLALATSAAFAERPADSTPSEPPAATSKPSPRSPRAERKWLVSGGMSFWTGGITIAPFGIELGGAVSERMTLSVELFSTPGGSDHLMGARLGGRMYLRPRAFSGEEQSGALTEISLRFGKRF